MIIWYLKVPYFLANPPILANSPTPWNSKSQFWRFSDGQIHPMKTWCRTYTKTTSQSTQSPKLLISHPGSISMSLKWLALVFRGWMCKLGFTRNLRKWAHLHKIEKFQSKRPWVDSRETTVYLDLNFWKYIKNSAFNNFFFYFHSK